jgi:hypothetical protein
VHSAQKASDLIFLSVFGGIFGFVVSKAFPVQPSAQNLRVFPAIRSGLPVFPDFCPDLLIAKAF